MIDAQSRLFSSKVGIITNFPTKIYRKVTHCIFDMDGTLLDSELVYHQMVHKICEKYGKNYSKKMENKFCGGTDREICVAVVKELKLPISADEMENQLTHISYKMLPHSPLLAGNKLFLPSQCLRGRSGSGAADAMHTSLQKQAAAAGFACVLLSRLHFGLGAERLLRHLHDYKIPLALATNSTEQAVRLHVATKPAFFGLFHHKVSVTEVLRGKPHPDLYLLAASRFPEKPKPAKCLVFEDSEKGVLAAREAGMQVVMIPDVRIDREKTRAATLVIRSLLDFKPELFGLPPFDGTKGENKTRPHGNKVTDKTEQLEKKTSKDELNKSMLERLGQRKSIYENIVERKSIRLSIIDKLVGRTSMQERKGLDEQPRGISFIDKLLERKGTENSVENKDERKSKGISERYGNRTVSISDGPYKSASVGGAERPFVDSLVGKSRKTSLENKPLKALKIKEKVHTTTKNILLKET